MEFEKFFINCLNMLMVQLFQHLFLLPSAGAFPFTFILDLNYSDCVMLSCGSSL